MHYFWRPFTSIDGPRVTRGHGGPGATGTRSHGGRRTEGNGGPGATGKSDRGPRGTGGHGDRGPRGTGVIDSWEEPHCGTVEGRHGGAVGGLPCRPSTAQQGVPSAEGWSFDGTAMSSLDSSNMWFLDSGTVRSFVSQTARMKVNSQQQSTGCGCA